MNREEQKDNQGGLRIEDLLDSQMESETERPGSRRSGGKKSGEKRSDGKKTQGRSGGIGIYLLTGMACIIVILLIVYIALAAQKKKEQEAMNQKVTYTQAEMELLLTNAMEEAKRAEADRILEGIKENLQAGEATALALRPFYPNDVVVTLSGKVCFYPIQEELRKNSYQGENLTVLENGEYQYLEGGQVISHKGIDVSYFQGEIDWRQVAEDGVEFAILRVGLRGYGTGRVAVDEQFENNVKGAIGNGVKVGVYFFSQSVDTEEALEEANFVLEQIAPYRITGPVVYDAELIPDSRTSGLTPDERTDMAIAFCDKVAESGYRPMIYLNLNTAFTAFDLTRLEDYDKWYAHYTSEMYYPYDYVMWQYSESGKVKGIDADVDLNISFEGWE